MNRYRQIKELLEENSLNVLIATTDLLLCLRMTLMNQMQSMLNVTNATLSTVLSAKSSRKIMTARNTKNKQKKTKLCICKLLQMKNYENVQIARLLLRKQKDAIILLVDASTNSAIFVEKNGKNVTVMNLTVMITVVVQIIFADDEDLDEELEE